MFLKTQRLITVVEALAELSVHAGNGYYAMPRPKPAKQDGVLSALVDARQKAISAGNGPEHAVAPAQSTSIPTVPALPPLLTALPAELSRPLREFDPATALASPDDSLSDGGDSHGTDASGEMDFSSPPLDVAPSIDAGR